MIPFNEVTVSKMPDVKVGEVVDFTYTFLASGEEIKEKVRITDIRGNTIYFEAVDDANA